MAVLDGKGSAGRFVSCAPQWLRGYNTIMNGLCYSFRQDEINQISELKINKRTFQHRLIPLFEKGSSNENGKFNMENVFAVYMFEIILL